MKKLKKRRQAGTFTLLAGKDVYGELTLAGDSTSLYLQDKDYLGTHEILNDFVVGTLYDLTKVTLIKCVIPPAPGSVSRGNQGYYYTNIFPHFVVYGDRHIDPTEKQITAVNFFMDDATTLFYDFDAFGSLFDASPFIEQIVHARGIDREIATGPDARIAYFTGKREIFATNTVLGKVSASHNPGYDLGGPNGVRLENMIFVTIAFEEQVDFDDAIARTSVLLKYFGMLVGRPQNLLKLYLNIASDEERAVPLEVYWSMPPKRDSSYGARKPHSFDVLLDAVRQPAVFSRVLGSWLERQQDWHDARGRFFTFFAKREYTIDRLIAAANMFDILPDSAVPINVEPLEELKRATDECYKIFKSLPQSSDRANVLLTLRRIGKSVLKDKIRHRGQILIDKIGQVLPNIFTVIDAAVNCRNHYVHGSKTRFDYNANFDAVIFFTDTMEFVFAASDLVEAGWDVKVWCEASNGMSHPFGQFCANYSENHRRFRSLIG
jgi:hypothetical protein